MDWGYWRRHEKYSAGLGIVSPTRCYSSNLSRVSFTRAEHAPGVGWTQLYFGLGFTTLATLILELSLTRIFSVVFYYHFAFLAISVALFGLGAGGVFSYVVVGSG